MKKSVWIFLCFFTMTVAFAGELISIPINNDEKLVFPVPIEKYWVKQKGIVEIQEVSNKEIKIRGIKIGETNLTVNAGVTKNYTISVKSNIGDLMKRLRNDLNISTLRFRVSGENIRIEGKVTRQKDWKRLQTIIELPDYKSKVVNLAEFVVSDRLIGDLKKELEKENFILAADGKKPVAGEISVSIDKESNIVTISAELFNKKSEERLRRILMQKNWLAIDAEPDENKGQIKCNLNTQIAEMNVCVDVVYIGVTKSEAEKFGADKVPKGVFDFGVIYDILSGKGVNRTAQFGGNITATVEFLKSNGISRIHHAGTIYLGKVLKGKLHVGSTISVPVKGESDGSLQEINAGLMFEVDGEIQSQKEIELNVKLTNTTAIEATQGGYGRNVNTIEVPARNYEFGKTFIIGSSDKMNSQLNNSGVPLLRNLPVLRWFFGGESKGNDSMRLTVLISPRLDTGEKIMLPTDDPGPEFEPEPKRFTGWLSWLNWFTW